MKNKLELPLLEDYLDGKLSLDQRLEIEKLLTTDSELEAEVQALMLAREAIEMHGWKTDIAKTQEAYLDTRKIRSIDSSPTQNSKPNWYLRIAASASIILVGLATFIFIKTSPESLDQHFLSYQVPVMRGSAEIESRIKKAYQSEDYQEVIEMAALDSELDLDSRFLLGMAYLELGKGKEAVDELQIIEKINESSSIKLYVEETDYYLFRAYLMNGDYNLAQNQIEKIRSNTRHKYYQNVNRWDAMKIKILELKN
ncbi:MAG: hypothetical protein HLUCCX10_10020 [Algoriphagus marincola HL-49]|uniref:Uncharacterized protein n=1 Tax=Algoriphagus marincola HL-49 TaxID=1305737 RepID=A0A0P8BXC3_9BACT|nr:MAG: hypothetical protein HLUCCX10_10020 [Algoriphagus marincola HL-49]